MIYILVQKIPHGIHVRLCDETKKGIAPYITDLRARYFVGTREIGKMPEEGILKLARTIETDPIFSQERIEAMEKEMMR